MKKELKELIKERKLSDDELIKIINSYKSESESEKDIKDEDDEPEDAAGSEEQPKAEKEPAKEVLTVDLVKKMIDEAIKNSAKKQEAKPQAPIKKAPPKNIASEIKDPTKFQLVY